MEAGHERATPIADRTQESRQSCSPYDAATVAASRCKEARKAVPINGGNDGSSAASQGGICGQAVVQAQEEAPASIVFFERITVKRGNLYGK